ncbi:MAG: citrate/2-methylcitrate synthase, partial [Actinomycetes bacterium]
VLFILHADHEQNASTNAVRSVGSTQVDPYSAVSAGVGALFGPLHGGANEAVLKMLRRIGSKDKVPEFIEGVKEGKERLMGFGHRVYRAEDPRARVLRRTCAELKAPRYEVACALEQAALAQLRERRPDHPIETNVEFWAAVILDFAEVPPHMMPAMFTSARTAGWSAHILEQKREGKLVRPSAQYIGPGPRRPQDVDGWQAVGG